jgi:hypothetical protein
MLRNSNSGGLSLTTAIPTNSKVDLTFIDPCIESIFQYTIYPKRCNFTQYIYIWKLLYMFWVVLPPIIRSAKNFFFFFFQALNFLVESFGLLNDLFPFFSILDAGYPVLVLQLANVLFDVILPSVLALSCDLLVRGFQFPTFLTVLVSGILCTWPNKLSLWALMWLILFLCFIRLSNSSLVLIPHIWFSFMGPNILLKVFLSKTNSFWIMVSFYTHVSEA